MLMQDADQVCCSLGLHIWVLSASACRMDCCVALPSIRAYFDLPLDALGALLVMFTMGYLLSSFSSGRLLTHISVGSL